MSEVAERLALAAQADDALKRFLSPAFAVAREDYRAKLNDLYAQIDDAKVERARTKLALALRILDEAEQQIVSIVRGGDMARAEKRHADRIADLPAYKKFGIGLS